jgi:hypothetical protein
MNDDSSPDSATEKLLSSFEGHDLESIRSAIEAGADCVSPVRGKSPIEWLLGDYSRSDRLKICLDLLTSHGAVLEDPHLIAVLTDDETSLRDSIARQPSLVSHRTSLDSAFVSLKGVTLLHVAAEFGCAISARVLIEAGADVNARADIDSEGCNGHTPIFHTVNSIANRSEPLMRMLLDTGARIDIRLDAMRWGHGYEWETIFFDVTPVSFAQMGLMPQVHRREQHIYSNIQHLLLKKGRRVPKIRNVPNAYLKS